MTCRKNAVIGAFLKCWYPQSSSIWTGFSMFHQKKHAAIGVTTWYPQPPRYKHQPSPCAASVSGSAGGWILVMDSTPGSRMNIYWEVFDKGHHDVYQYIYIFFSCLESYCRCCMKWIWHKITRVDDSFRTHDDLGSALFFQWGLMSRLTDWSRRQTARVRLCRS